jgi:hypothetical protein
MCTMERSRLQRRIFGPSSTLLEDWVWQGSPQPVPSCSTLLLPALGSPFGRNPLTLWVSLFPCHPGSMDAAAVYRLLAALPYLGTPSSHRHLCHEFSVVSMGGLPSPKALLTTRTSTTLSPRWAQAVPRVCCCTALWVRTRVCHWPLWALPRHIALPQFLAGPLPQAQRLLPCGGAPRSLATRTPSSIVLDAVASPIRATLSCPGACWMPTRFPQGKRPSTLSGGG